MDTQTAEAEHGSVPSEPETTPPCPHRPPCPGCPRYGARELPEDALTALGSLARESGLPWPIVQSGAALEYRHRSRLAVRGRASSPKVGIFAAGTHRIVDIPRCGIHHPRINHVARLLRACIRETGTRPYADSTHAGVVRYAQIVVERESERAQLVVVTNDVTPDRARPLLDALASRGEDALQGLWWNGQPARSNTILGPHWEHIAGAEATRDRLGGIDVYTPPGAFGQANLPLFSELAARVRSLVQPGCRVVEAYAGCGAIGLPLLPRVAALTLHERAPHALRGLALGLAERPASERARATVLGGDAAADDRLVAACAAADVVVVDPPRRGVDEALLAQLERQPPARLIYVSCGLGSFVAQTERLLASGRVRLTGLEAWALFPHTSHVETLAVLDRV